MATNKQRWFDLERSVAPDGATVLRIFGPIAGGWFPDDFDATGAAEFIRELDTVPGDLELHVNSPGGEVFEGFAIYNALAAFRGRKRKITGYVDGSAMSIASVILMACDRVIMPANAYQMIHLPWTFAEGNAEELLARAAELEKLGQTITDIYATRSGKDRETIAALLKGAEGADGSFLTAAECAELGIADEVIPDVAAAACAGAEHWRGVPAALLKKKTEVSAEDTSDFADWFEVVRKLKERN